jgi:hypothetical protein
MSRIIDTNGPYVPGPLPVEIGVIGTASRRIAGELRTEAFHIACLFNDDPRNSTLRVENNGAWKLCHAAADLIDAQRKVIERLVEMGGGSSPREKLASAIRGTMFADLEGTP